MHRVWYGGLLVPRRVVLFSFFKSIFLVSSAHWFASILTKGNILLIIANATCVGIGWLLAWATVAVKHQLTLRPHRNTQTLKTHSPYRLMRFECTMTNFHDNYPAFFCTVPRHNLGDNMFLTCHMQFSCQQDDRILKDLYTQICLTALFRDYPGEPVSER